MVSGNAVTATAAGCGGGLADACNLVGDTMADSGGKCS